MKGIQRCQVIESELPIPYGHHLGGHTVSVMHYAFNLQ